MRGQPGGFTLLEVLVALAVLGFMMAGLAQAARFGARAWDAQALMTNERSELDAVDRALRRLLERMDPGRDKEAASLQGTADRFLVVSGLPMAVVTATRQAEVAVLAIGGRLVLRWAPFQHARRLGPPAQPTEEELLRGIARVEFAYQGPAGAWSAAWSEQTLPALVRLRVLFPPGDRRRWPDIVVAPLRDRPAG